MARYLLIDTAGSELGTAEIEGPVEEGLTVDAGNLGIFLVVETYEGDDGAADGMAATVVVDEA
jgi:hypothetical protein